MGLGAPEGFALGAARGSSHFCSSSRVSGWSGHLSPTVVPPARTMSGISGTLLFIIVSGPGQNSRASVSACSGTSLQHLYMASTP